MAITLDPTTQQAYLTATTLSARTTAVVSAFSGTVTVKVFDGTDTERASGTFDGAWASGAGGTITVGEVVSLTVSSGGTPDADWYVLFEDADSWIRGTFGLGGSGKDFTWSGPTFETGQVGDLGTITFTAIDPNPETAPVNTALPAITGTVRVGEVLSASTGTWSSVSTPTYAYQWLRGGANISAAISSTYTQVAADETTLIQVDVTATNTAGSTTARSAAVGPVAAAYDPLTIETVPDITINQGGTYELSQHVSGGSLPYTAYDIDSGALPTGVTLNLSTGTLTAAVDATTTPVTGLAFGVTDSEAVASVPAQYTIWDGAEGTTQREFVALTDLNWANINTGDWLDANQLEQGSTAFASFAVSALTDYNVTVTSLIARQMTTGVNRGIFLRGTAGDWNFGFGGRLNATVAARPVLTVVTTNNTFTPELTASACWSLYSDNVVDGTNVFYVERTNYSSLLQFDLSGITGTVVSANLKLTCTTRFSATAETIGVFEGNQPAYSLGGDFSLPGLAQAYPDDVGIDAHPSVIWTCQDWSTANFGGWDQVTSPERGAAEADPVTGLKYIRLTMAAGQRDVTNLTKRLMVGTTSYGPPTSVVTEVYFRYRLYVEDDWRSTVDNSKAPGFDTRMGYWDASLGRWIAIGGNGQSPATGMKIPQGTGYAYDGHSLRGHLGGRVQANDNPWNEVMWLGGYIYNLDQEDFSGSAPRWGNVVLKRGQWYNIERYCKLNTLSGAADADGNQTANADGELRAWVDGELFYEQTDWRWRRHPEMGINHIWMLMFHGGQEPTDVTMHCRWANLVIANAYIGPVNES